MYLCCLCKGKKEVYYNYGRCTYVAYARGKKEVYYNYGRCTYVAYARGKRKCTIIMEDILMLLMQGEEGSVL